MRIDPNPNREFPITLYGPDGNVVDRAGNICTAENIINQSDLPVVDWHIPAEGVGYVTGNGMSRTEADTYLTWVLETARDCWGD